MERPATDVTFERRVLAIVELILDASPTERAALLEERCGEDAHLREEVLALLALDEDGRLLPIEGLPRLHPAALEDEPDPEQGHRVGSYEIVRPIGGGGMGRVFEALQERPRRRVALKMLRFGLGSGSARRRFEVESEILARLRHPAIAQVFEAGVHSEDSPTGLREIPYYALEFVEGARTIVEDVRARGLDRRSTLELFVGVCGAIHHGHQRGVIHRDIKAANVLVGQDGAPKVIDFGVARLIGPEERGLTGTSELVGTLSSMSPEQLAGDPDDVDLRCDVYALGVLLYELLCGRLPHDVRGLPLHEASRRIVETSPPAPRRVVPDLAPELETILLTALARDPDDRYSSALDLSEDLRRFLAHEPIQARAVGRLRRATLFVRRHRVPVFLSTGIAITLLVTAVTSMTLARERRAALEDADVMEARLLDYSQDMTMGFLRELQSEGVPTATRLALVRTAIENLQELERNAGEDPEVLLALAYSYLRMGSLLGNPFLPNLGNREAAEESYRHALTILEQLLETRPEDLELRLAIINAELGLGDVVTRTGSPEASAAGAQRALEVSRELLAERPDHAPTRRALARALFSLGFSQHSDPRQTIGYLDEAEEQYRKLLAQSPGEASLHYELASLLSSRGSAHAVFGDLELALGDLEEADSLYDRALELEPDHALYRRGRANNTQYLATTLRFDGAPGEVILELLAPAVTELEALRTRDPDDVSLLETAVMFTIEQTQALMELERPDAARTSLAKLERLLASSPLTEPPSWHRNATAIAARMRATLAPSQ